MKTTVIEKVTGRELPREWAERAEVLPDEVVRVTISPNREKAVQELIAFMDEVGEEAERRGLTDEKLAELLKDES